MRKRIVILVLIAISCIEAYSQIIFESGYFIDDSNKKVECLINNIDWRNNPTGFKYKLSENEPEQTATIQTVQEFQIYNVSKYIRAKTNIDRSSDQLDRMSSERNPNFKEELLFLKVLIEGRASLFLYVDGDLTRFFYKLNDSAINQLVYKRYLITNRIFENNAFKQELFVQLKCEGIGLQDIEHIRYVEGDLERLFIKYNTCTRSEYINYVPKQKRDFFNLSVRPGLNYRSLEIQNTMAPFKVTDFGGNFGFRLGIEAEFILPFNKNKWGIILEPTYQYYKSEKSEESSSVSGGILISKVDYKSIELPVGLRYYLFFNDKSKLFLNVSYSFDFSINSSINFLRKDNSVLSKLDLKSGRNIALGVGYKYRNRYSIEMRYHTNREILGDYLYWSSKYYSFNLIFGYSMF